MFFLMKLAGRNLFRNTKRSILAMITIIVGVMGFILSSGLVDGIEQTYIRLEIASESAHLRILPHGYLKEDENLPLDITLKNPEKISKILLKKFPKAIVVPRILFSAEIGDGVYTLRIRGVGVAAKNFEKAFKFSQFTDSKKVLPEKGMVMYLGAQLAKSFKKKTGDMMTILARTQAGSINAIDFKIIGVLSVGNLLVDNFSFYIPLQTARELLGMKRDVTDLVVMFPSKELAFPAARLIQTLEPFWHAKKKILSLSQVEVSDDEHSFDVLGLALTSSVASQVIKNPSFVEKFSQNEEKKGIFLREDVAQKMGKRVSDVVTLALKTGLGVTVEEELPILGFFAKASRGASLLMPLKLGQQLVRKYEPVTWWTKAQDIIAMNKLRRKSVSFLVFIILLVAASGVANMMLMSGFERQGEIGMMMALGMPTSRIMGLFTLEATFLGVLGSLIGGVLGTALVYYLQVHGIDISGQMGTMDSAQGMMTLATIIYFKLLPRMVILGVSIGIIVSILSAIWPAWRITRFEPNEILSKS